MLGRTNQEAGRGRFKGWLCRAAAGGAALFALSACDPGTVAVPTPVAGPTWSASSLPAEKPDTIQVQATCPASGACTGSIAFKLSPGGATFTAGSPISGGLLNSDLTLCTKAPCAPGGALIFYGTGSLVPSPGAAAKPYSFTMTAYDLDNADESQSKPNMIFVDLCRPPAPGGLCGLVLVSDISENFSCSDSGTTRCIEITQSTGTTTVRSEAHTVPGVRAPASSPFAPPMLRLAGAHSFLAVTENLRERLAVALPRLRLNLAVSEPVAALGKRFTT